MLKDVWAELEKDPSETTERGLLKRLVAECPRNISAAICKPSGCWALTFVVNKRHVPAPDLIPAAKGFDLAVFMPEQKHGAEDVTIVLSANALEYNSLFATMADDILEASSLVEDEGTLVSLLLDRLGLWHRFFQGCETDRLTPEQQVGLYGELVFIDECMQAGEDHGKVIAAWVGPEKRHHDFQFGPSSVEVKTSSSRRPHIRITSEDQLDATGAGRLYIFYVSLSRVQSFDEDLPQLVSLIRSRLKGKHLVEFNRRLIMSGYLDSHATWYAGSGYHVHGTVPYLVSDTFPRITKSHLPGGVFDVSYAISLGACEPYRVNEIRLWD